MALFSTPPPTATGYSCLAGLGTVHVNTPTVNAHQIPFHQIECLDSELILFLKITVKDSKRCQ